MARHAETSRRLTPHHRIHSIAMQLEVKELMGMWASITAVAAEVERAVAENLATPCIRNSRSLLVEAVAHAYAGEKDDARRLEEEGLELAFEGFGFRLFGPRVRLALLRGELDVVEWMIDEDVARRGHDWMVTSAMVTTRLHALVALGRREAIETEAGPLSRSPSCGRSPCGRWRPPGRTTACYATRWRSSSGSASTGTPRRHEGWRSSTRDWRGARGARGRAR